MAQVSIRVDHFIAHHSSTTRHLFYWVWVPLIQEYLDSFKYFHNNHKIRKQRNKKTPSGASPDWLTRHPTSYDPTAVNCGIPVDPKWVAQERQKLGGMEERKRLFQWYPEEFGTRATEAWITLGQPTRTLTTSWSIFRNISDALLMSKYDTCPSNSPTGSA